MTVPVLLVELHVILAPLPLEMEVLGVEQCGHVEVRVRDYLTGQMDVLRIEQAAFERPQGKHDVHCLVLRQLPTLRTALERYNRDFEIEPQRSLVEAR